MHSFKLAAAAAALVLAGAAHAQEGPGPAPSGPPPGPPEMRGPDDKMNDFLRMRDEVEGRKAGPTRSKTPVPVSPEDVITGAEVRDSKGLVLGMIERVGMDYAVVASEAGKVEVEFASLAKNNKGLMINMPKAKFEEIVSASKKPAKPAN